MAEPMTIFELQKYAQEHDGYNTGRFICVSEKGLSEWKWIDAYFGFVELLQPKPKQKGFITVNQLREIFGNNQEYLPTIGYDNGDESIE